MFFFGGGGKSSFFWTSRIWGFWGRLYSFLDFENSPNVFVWPTPQLHGHHPPAFAYLHRRGVAIPLPDELSGTRASPPPSVVERHVLHVPAPPRPLQPSLLHQQLRHHRTRRQGELAWESLAIPIGLGDEYDQHVAHTPRNLPWSSLQWTPVKKIK